MRFLYKTICILTILLMNSILVLPIEPVSTVFSVLGAIGLGGIYAGWDYLKCSTQECCHTSKDVKGFVKGDSWWQWHRRPWIDYQLNDLEQSLNTRLHGQHLVKNIITKLIRKHMSSEEPEKALVMSFHGWTGGGKNFVSEIVAKNIFRKFSETSRSDFVHHFICTHFNTNDKQLIRQWIKNNVTNAVKSCHRSFFIFDEIDKLLPGVIDIIKPFVDYNTYVDGIDYRKSIFIFLSNTGGDSISKLTYDFYLKGSERTDLEFKDLEPLINLGAFNENGGLSKSDIVEKNLINAFIPFLPLERKHIRLCIIDYLKQHYNKSDPTRDPGEEFIRNVANEMEYFPPDTKLYSKTGCKKVGPKVDVLI